VQLREPIYRAGAAVNLSIRVALRASGNMEELAIVGFRRLVYALGKANRDSRSSRHLLELGRRPRRSLRCMRTLRHGEHGEEQQLADTAHSERSDLRFMPESSVQRFGMCVSSGLTASFVARRSPDGSLFVVGSPLTLHHLP